MIVKHFYHNIWELGYNWENTDHVFGAPDSDLQVEQNEKSIAASLEIFDDEQDMEEGGGRTKSCLCHHTRIYITYKQVPGGEEEQADEMCKIIN
jgi:hypothetical protein